MPRELKDVFEFGPFRLDAEDGSLRRGDEVVHLPRKAADVLVLLVEEPGVVRSRNELTAGVWDVSVGPGSLDYQIHRIRRALGVAPDGTDYIETVPRRGFRFAGTVRRIRRRNDRITEDGAATIAPEAVAASAPGSASDEPARTGWQAWRRIRVAGILVAAALAAAIALAGLAPGESLRIVESRPLQLAVAPLAGYPLLTDGTRVYFPSMSPRRQLAVSLAGGDPIDPFGHAGLELEDPGRPGTDALAIRNTGEGAEGELWIVPAASGVPERVGNLTAIQAAWSPDQRRIALISRNRVFLADRSGSTAIPVPLPPRAERCTYPRWSPDGSLVRFTASVPRDALVPEQSIWEVRSDGEGLRPIQEDWDASINACCGVWSPDGRFFVFQGTRGDRRVDLWVLAEPDRFDRLMGRRPRAVPLTSGPLSLSGPAFGADGRTLLATGTLMQGELVRWDRTAQAFVPYLGGLSGAFVTFSPGGESVAYVGYPDRQLWRARADGSERRVLVGGDFEMSGVGWSPDGRWISFRSRMAGRQMKIFLMPSEGGTPVPITNDDVEQGSPSWSADGERLVYGDVPAQFGVPDGDEVLHLYDVRNRTFSTVPGSHGLWTARWSPDGRYISALTIDREQRMKLFDTATEQWRTLDVVHVNSPNWSRDSQYVYYDTEGGIFEQRRVRIADGQVELLTAMDFPLAVWGWSGLAPDDSPMVLRNLSVPRIYELTLARGR